MKKLLFLILLSAFALVTSAQPICYSGTASVTNTNSATNYIYPLRANGDTITYGQAAYASYQLTSDKVSGTASGTAILQGTLTAANGNWVNLDTLTITNTAHLASSVWTINPMIYRRVRVAVTTSGTQVVDATLIHNWINWPY